MKPTAVQKLKGCRCIRDGFGREDAFFLLGDDDVSLTEMNYK